ncbi:hypothetical protein H9P43_006613 [Blastocladiella emersonii ATCC 22665]|nr:hypothetical protein H9P43_006613 [Blastocladiella emersonii ATCC 22665]
MAAIMIAVNLVIGYLHAEQVMSEGGNWSTFEIRPILLILNSVQALWGIICTIYAYRSAFSNTSHARVTGSVANLSTAARTGPPLSSNSSGSHAHEVMSSRSGQHQHLLASVQQTYLVLTISYAVGWAASLTFLGTSGAFMSVGPRWTLASMFACAGILQETQFRRIVRSRVNKGKQLDKRAVMHFDDTMATATVAGTTAASELGASTHIERDTQNCSPPDLQLGSRGGGIRQHLLASVRQTYAVLTLIYIIGWIASLVFLGTSGAYLSMGPRSLLSSLLACGGILHETQFRKIWHRPGRRSSLILVLGALFVGQALNDVWAAFGPRYPEVELWPAYINVRLALMGPSGGIATMIQIDRTAALCFKSATTRRRMWAMAVAAWLVVSPLNIVCSVLDAMDLIEKGGNWAEYTGPAWLFSINLVFPIVSVVATLVTLRTSFQMARPTGSIAGWRPSWPSRTGSEKSTVKVLVDGTAAVADPKVKATRSADDDHSAVTLPSPHPRSPLGSDLLVAPPPISRPTSSTSTIPAPAPSHVQASLDWTLKSLCVLSLVMWGASSAITLGAADFSPAPRFCISAMAGTPALLVEALFKKLVRAALFRMLMWIAVPLAALNLVAACYIYAVSRQRHFQPDFSSSSPAHPSPSYSSDVSSEAAMAAARPSISGVSGISGLTGARRRRHRAWLRHLSRRLLARSTLVLTVAVCLAVETANNLHMLLSPTYPEVDMYPLFMLTRASFMMPMAPLMNLLLVARLSRLWVNQLTYRRDWTLWTMRSVSIVLIPFNIVGYIIAAAVTKATGSFLHFAVPWMTYANAILPIQGLSITFYTMHVAFAHVPLTRRQMLGSDADMLRDEAPSGGGSKSGAVASSASGNVQSSVAIPLTSPSTDHRLAARSPSEPMLNSPPGIAPLPVLGAASDGTLPAAQPRKQSVFFPGVDQQQPSAPRTPPPPVRVTTGLSASSMSRLTTDSSRRDLRLAGLAGSPAYSMGTAARASRSLNHLASTSALLAASSAAPASPMSPSPLLPPPPPLLTAVPVAPPAVRPRAPTANPLQLSLNWTYRTLTLVSLVCWVLYLASQLAINTYSPLVRYAMAILSTLPAAIAETLFSVLLRARARVEVSRFKRRYTVLQGGGGGGRDDGSALALPWRRRVATGESGSSAAAPGLARTATAAGSSSRVLSRSSLNLFRGAATSNASRGDAEAAGVAAGERWTDLDALAPSPSRENHGGIEPTLARHNTYAGAHDQFFEDFSALPSPIDDEDDEDGGVEVGSAGLAAAVGVLKDAARKLPYPPLRPGAPAARAQAWIAALERDCAALHLPRRL